MVEHITMTSFCIPSLWAIPWHTLLSLLCVTPVKEGTDVAASMDIFSCDFTFSLLFIFILFPRRMGCVLNLLWNAEMNSLPRSEMHCFQNICIVLHGICWTAMLWQIKMIKEAVPKSVPLLMGLSCILGLLLSLLAFIETRLPQFSSRN